LKTKCCLDCFITISAKATRCNSCSAKFRGGFPESAIKAKLLWQKTHPSPLKKQKSTCLFCSKELSRLKYTTCASCKWKCAEYRKKQTASHLGKKPGNYGVPCSESTKKKLSLANKGKKYIGLRTQFKKGNVPWNKDKELPQYQKENSPHWKGGLGYTLSRQLQNSPKWKQMREDVFKRDDFTCQKCFKRGCEIHPHHIKPKSLFPNLVFELNNVITLCVKCHLQKGVHKYNIMGD
jgi:5-methylcytosine-specific restriction endonuclease McrA